MNKILILGINGFSGKYFQKFIEKNALTKQYDFIGIDKHIDYTSADYCRKINALNTLGLKKLLVAEKPDYIINLIGNFTSTDFLELLKINAEISRCICQTVIENNLSLKKIIFIGSAAEYGIPVNLPVKENDSCRPVNFYGLSKLIQTLYGKFYYNNFHLPICIARPFNIIGQGLSLSMSIANFAEQINKLPRNSKLHVGNLKNKRDFIDINDVIEAYWKILLKGKVGSIYNICSGYSISLKTILKWLIKKSTKKVHLVVEKSKYKKRDINDIYGDYSKLRRDTSWHPITNLKCSLESMIK